MAKKRKKKKQSDKEVAFREMITGRLGMKAPEEAAEEKVAQAWETLEAAIQSVESAVRDLPPEEAEPLAEGIQAAADAVQQVEDLLIELGVLEPEAEGEPAE
jgi:signal transduction histidine kinase